MVNCAGEQPSNLVRDLIRRCPPIDLSKAAPRRWFACLSRLPLQPCIDSSENVAKSQARGFLLNLAWRDALGVHSRRLPARGDSQDRVVAPEWRMMHGAGPPPASELATS
jgi:hypothetical protein